MVPYAEVGQGSVRHSRIPGSDGQRIPESPSGSTPFHRGLCRRLRVTPRSRGDRCECLGLGTPAAIVFTNTDTTTLRDMDLFLRYDDRMDEDTLTVRIAVVTPDSLRHEEAFRLALPAAHTPAALSREADLPYRRRIRFARTGDYCITVTPGRPVKGVEAVGINIVKSE